MTRTRRQAFEAAQGALLAEYGVVADERRIRLADPPLSVHVLEAGAGEPVLLVHGSGMSAATWTPLLARLRNRRAVAVDLPGFGLSDPHDYRGRSLRRHAVSQPGSILDALGVDRAPIVGTSLGAMWALCLALDEPKRVSAVVGLGVPAVALAGMCSDPFFRAMTLPWLGKLVARRASVPVAMVPRRPHFEHEAVVCCADPNYAAPVMRCVRLYTDDDGQSRFEDLDFVLAAKDFAPPAPPVDVSEAIDASAFMMLRAPAGWTDAMHPAPARQFFIVLAGSWEVSAGGDTRLLSAGDLVLTEDTSGPGHASTVLEDTVVAVVRL